MKYEKLWRYLFNQFFCGNLDRLGGNMSDLMEEALSHNITHLTREREQKSIFRPRNLWKPCNFIPENNPWSSKTLLFKYKLPFQPLQRDS